MSAFSISHDLIGGVLIRNSSLWSRKQGGGRDVVTLEEVWSGRPQDMLTVRSNPSVFFPGFSEINFEEGGIWWTCTVFYGGNEGQTDNIVASDWEMDASNEEVPLHASPIGKQLDYAFTGWPRLIEISIDNHLATTPAYAFDYTTIQAAALKDSTGLLPATINYSQFSQSILNLKATSYAKSYLRGTSAFPEPKYVLRNQVTITPAYVFLPTSVLYSNVNVMISPSRMIQEPLLLGEVIPNGFLVPEVNWWFKQPMQTRRTSDNLVVINREWIGAEEFDENIFQSYE